MITNNKILLFYNCNVCFFKGKNKINIHKQIGVLKVFFTRIYDMYSDYTYTVGASIIIIIIIIFVVVEIPYQYPYILLY